LSTADVGVVHITTPRPRRSPLFPYTTLFRSEPLPLSPSLAETMRPYQQIGASWMYHLFKHQLGGVLADEMGLGKTLQALALLAADRKSTRLNSSHVKISYAVFCLKKKRASIP